VTQVPSSIVVFPEIQFSIRFSPQVQALWSLTSPSHRQVVACNVGAIPGLCIPGEIGFRSSNSWRDISQVFAVLAGALFRSSNSWRDISQVFAVLAGALFRSPNSWRDISQVFAVLAGAVSDRTNRLTLSKARVSI